MKSIALGARALACALALGLALAPVLVHADPPTAADARAIFRDYNTDGVPASGVYNPQKSALRGFFANMADAVGGLFTAERVISVIEKGAVCDGLTDDATAFAAAFTAAGAGGVVRIPQHLRCRVSYLSIPAGVTLKGWLERPDFNGGGNSSTSLNTLPGLLLDSTGTITLAQGASVTNLYVQKYGLTFPQASPSNFGGTAFTFAGDSPTLRNVLAVGFSILVAETSTSVSRFNIEHFYGDGQAGIYLTKPSWDSSHIRNVHLWPFGTQPNTTCAALKRSGSGFYLNAAQDDTYIDDVLTYGFAIGVNLAATGSVGFGKVWTDYPSACASGSGSIGIYAQANVTGISFAQAWIWASEYGLVTTMNAGEKIKFGTAHFDTISSSAITSTGGDLDFAQLQCKTIGSHCIVANSATSHIRARGSASGVVGAVVLPLAGADPNFLDVRLVSDAAAGTSSFSGGTVAPTSVASAATLALPINGDQFTITGSTGPIATVSGGWGGREVILTFTSTPTLNESGNLKLATSTYTAAAGDKIRFIYDSAISKFVETSRGPGPARMSRASPPAASSCGTSPSVDSASNSFAGKFTTGASGTSCVLTDVTAWAAAPYCVVTPTAAPAAIANVPYIAARTASAMTLAGLTASTGYHYLCLGSQ